MKVTGKGARLKSPIARGYGFEKAGYASFVEDDPQGICLVKHSSGHIYLRCPFVGAYGYVSGNNNKNNNNNNNVRAFLRV